MNWSRRFSTDREREVLAAVARDANNAAIGDELFIDEATVRSHVSSILTKLGSRDRAQMWRRRHVTRW
ncbi:hypothetical protein BH23ACT10_BH23ACT10_16260 [soil metagenome]